MHLEIGSFGNTKVVRVKERALSFPLLGDFFARTVGLIDSGARALVIDLADVVLLDGASLACLTDISRIMSRRKGTLRLVGLQGRLERLVNMVGLSRLMEVSRDRPSCR